MTLINISLKTISIAIVSIACFSCTANTKNKSNQLLGQNVIPKVEYGDILQKKVKDSIPEKSDYIMISVKLTQYSDDNSSSESVRYTNIIFYNKFSGKSHLLLDKKSLIIELEFVKLSEKDNKDVSFLILSIVDKDTNEDGYLNWDDAEIGYLYNISGKKLQQITPQNSNLSKWHFDHKSKTVFLEIIKDINKDNKFTTQKEASFLKVSVDKPGIGTEIISNDIELQNNFKKIGSIN